MRKGNRIKELARRFKLLYPEKNIKHILKEEGIEVCYLDENIVSDGAFLNLTSLTTIFINSKIEDEYKLRLLLFHELFHTKLHPEINTMQLRKLLPHFVEKYEKEANLLTAEYLLDDNVFEKYSGYSLEYIAKEEHVSLKLVKLKLENLDPNEFPYPPCCL